MIIFSCQAQRTPLSPENRGKDRARRAFALALALFAATAPLALGESGTMPAPPLGVVETGAPAFVVLGPEALGLGAAPTDLHLLPDGRILAVSRREIAFGDGVHWEVFQAAPGQAPIVSQVAVDTDGHIYTGVEGGIARVDFNTEARWFLTRVTDLPAQTEFQHSTMVSVTQVGNQWYWYGGGGIVTWRPGQIARGVADLPSLDRIFTVGEKIFLRGITAGILELAPDGTTRRLNPEGQSVGESVTAEVDFAPGLVLIGTVSAGLQLFDGTTFRRFNTNGWADGHRVTGLCAAAGGYFAAAFDGIGIVFFNREGQAVQVLDRTLDHRLGRVRKMFNGRDGVLWAVLNEGVARVEFPSPLSSFEPIIAGGLGYAKPTRHEGKLWLQADGRVLRAIYTAAGRLERFEEEQPPGEYVFTLAEIDGRLFASNENGLFVYENSQWNLAVAGIVNARLVPARGSARGWPYFAKGEFGFIRDTPAGYVAERIPTPDLGDNYGAVVDAMGVVWLELGTGRAGRLDPREANPKVQFFGATDGLAQQWVEIYLLEGIARLHLANHLWRYDNGTKKLVEDRELAQRFPSLVLADGRPIIDPLGRLWHTVAGAVRLLEPDAAGNYVEKKVPVHFGPYEYTVQDDGVLWFFADFHFSRLDLRVSTPTPSPLEASITSVQYSSSSRRIFRPGTELASLPYTDNSLVFYFSAPANPFASPVSFEVMLEGAGTQWVSTGSTGSAAFNRLKEGKYVFRVRPLSGANAPGKEARISFTLRPPWYRTPLAWFSYAVSAIGLFAFSAWLVSYLQRRENERLELLVTVRTEELSRQIVETTEKSAALSVSEERYRILNAELEGRVQRRTAELSLSNAELQQRESLFRLIFEHAPVGISWQRADLGGNYHLNATFRRILDLSGTSTDSTPQATLVHPEDAARQTELNQRIKSGALDSYNLEERFVLKSGRIVWGSLSVAVIRNERGQIVQDIGILEDITARKHAEEELAKTYKNLVEASRLAGMAEVATGVLHNVGNVLNSLNVSSNLVTETVRQSRVDGLVKLAALVNEHAGNLGEFLTQDPKGKLVPNYLEKLAEHSVKERDGLLQEVTSMQKNIDHIKEIIAMQQGHASAAGVVEELAATELFEDALLMNSADLARQEVMVVREFQPTPRLSVEKGKVLQILVNLIRNAKHACDDAQKTSSAPDRKIITLRTETVGNDRVRLIVRDNGIGIKEENLTRIFVHGFTTRSYGHGFGLHSSALAAKEMNGSLTASSAGPNRGAIFTLELPITPERVTREFPRARASALAGAV